MTTLRKRFNLVYGVGLAVSTIIGSGLLGLPGLAIDVGGAEAAAAGWLATALLSLPLILLFMGLATRVRNAGGIAHSSTLAFGPRAGAAVTLILAGTFALCIPIGTWMGSAYIQRIFGLPPGSVAMVSLLVLAGCTLVNVIGARPSALLNTFSVAVLCVLVIGLSVAHPGEVAAGGEVFASVLSGDVEVSLAVTWQVCAILFWAYLGWENLSFSTEEIQERPGLVRRIFLVGFVVVSGLYALLACVSIGAHVNGTNVSGVTGLLTLVEGTALAVVAKGLVVLVVIANVNAWVYAASRLVFAAGRSGLFPVALARLSRAEVPMNSLLALLAVYGILTLMIASEVLPLTTGLSVANQNFVVLYLVAAFAFLRLAPGKLSLAIAVVSVLACTFLLAGFGLWLLAPLALAMAGWWLGIRRADLMAERSGAA